MEEVAKLFCEILEEKHHLTITKEKDKYLRVVANYTTYYDIFEEFLFVKTEHSGLYEIYENNKSGYYNHLGLPKLIKILKSKNIPFVKTLNGVYVKDLFDTKGVYKITYSYHVF